MLSFMGCSRAKTGLFCSITDWASLNVPLPSGAASTNNHHKGTVEKGKVSTIPEPGWPSIKKGHGLRRHIQCSIFNFRGFGNHIDQNRTYRSPITAAGKAFSSLKPLLDHFIDPPIIAPTRQLSTGAAFLPFSDVSCYKRRHHGESSNRLLLSELRLSVSYMAGQVSGLQSVEQLG